MKPTLESVKNLTSAPEAIKAAEELFIAKAYEETVRDLIIPKQKEVLARHGFKTEYGEAIESPEQTWEMKDEDFQVYLREMHEFHIEKGFGTSFEYCPLLIAEDRTRKAQRAMIEASAPFTGISHEMIFSAPGSLERYAKLIELNMKLFAPIIEPRVADRADFEEMIGA